MLAIIIAALGTLAKHYPKITLNSKLSLSKWLADTHPSLAQGLFECRSISAFYNDSSPPHPQRLLLNSVQT